MDLSKLSINELKALAYDEIMHLKRHENNVRFVEAEILKRSEAESKIVEEKKAE